LKDGDPFVDTSKVLSYGGNQLREMIKQHFRKLKKYNVDPPTKAKITPKYKIEGSSELTNILNQPMDDEGTTTIAVQQVNTIQTAYVPMPIPMRSRSPVMYTPSLTLPPIWSP